jgi:hypothetical protein
VYPTYRFSRYLVSSWLLINLAVAPALLCQQSSLLPPVVQDSSSVGREAWPVFDPTVVAVVPAQETDTAFVQARALARDLGFQFAVTASATIIDVRSGAAYYLPTDVTRGYVLLSPGKAPDLIRGSVSARLLERRLRAYRDAPPTARPAPSAVPGERGAGPS